MLVFALLNWCYVVGAAPFVTTWNISYANESIRLPTLFFESNVTIDWGDSSTPTTFPANSSSTTIYHKYASTGLYNVSIEARFTWSKYGSPTKPKLVDIVSWGDGFVVGSNLQLFQDYSNLRGVSAPPNTQPVFLPGATLESMFESTSFNSSLDWDLTNVTRLEYMFAYTPINQPINFRNTQNVRSIIHMFRGASQFNQPFHFDATNLIETTAMFAGATAFNQVVNLTNSNIMTHTNNMFSSTSFNQPITFNINSVIDMSYMFSSTSSFNQPINFPSTFRLRRTAGMFQNATSFNQPVTLNTSNVDDMRGMFDKASSFSSPVNFTSTSRVTNMFSMFSYVVGFDQDLSSWDVSQVTLCANFCPRCKLPNFTSCVPCDPNITSGQTNACNATQAPTTFSPSRAPSAAPSAAPSSPSAAPSAPSGSAVSAAHAVGGEIFMLVGVTFFVVF